MQIGRILGLYLLGGGIIILLIYGLYEILKTITFIDPIVFISVTAIVLGSIILITSLIVERKGEDVNKIDKEDLKP